MTRHGTRRRPGSQIDPFCVAYAGGGVDSIVTPDVGTLSARDPLALGRTIRELLEDEPRRLEMAARARRRAEQRFDNVRLVAELERWLSDLVL